MRANSGFSFLYVSAILGRHVRDTEGRAAGHVIDLVARTSETYPILKGLIIGTRKVPGSPPRVAPFSGQILRDLARGAQVTIDPSALHDLELGANDFLVRDLLLDKQIVDVQGAKVERVNDVHLLVTDRAWIVHVDVGYSGLLRRLGFERAARRLWRFSRRPFREELISWKFVQPLAELREPGQPIRLKVDHAQIRDLHPGEIADILEDLGKDERAMIVHSLGPEAAADALEETEEEVQAAVISQLEPADAADILEEMDPGEAADILTSLPDAHSEEIIAEVEAPERAQLEQLIEYEEKTAAALMTPEFVWVGPDATVAEVITEVRRLAPEIEAIYYVYVLDAQRKLLGVTTLRRLLRVQPEERIGDVMETRLITVHPDDEPRVVAEVFQKYSFLGCPVVDAEMHMIGVILIKHAFDDLLPEFRREARS